MAGPGLRDVIITGKIKERIIAVDTQGRHVYDAVVVDSPPTGRDRQLPGCDQAMADWPSRGRSAIRARAW